MQWYESLIKSSFHIAHGNSYFPRKAKIKRDGYLISWLEAGGNIYNGVICD